MYSLVIGTLSIAIFAVFLWSIQRFRHQTSSVAVWQGAIVTGVSLLSFFLSSEHTILQAVVSIFASAWGVRTFVRAHRVFRKREINPETSSQTIKSIMFESVLAWCVVFPVLLVNGANDISWNIFSWIGSLVWILGFVVEVAAEYQYDSFSGTKPFMTNGLFRYSRHPERFGMSLAWWGIALMAFSSSFLWIAVVAPAIVTYRMVLLSSKEETALLSSALHEEYTQYQSHTSFFVPWFS